ncbi:hypothetical protein [Prescottella agglutinans]|uniref:Lipoprotein n=1 Tax=Prescottella agglutinans TaxID=1644129 RepID=A0ABT6MIK4_9NOCA|nr:hypothetical protein [Prescottella agglutinans]MDH6284147.1 hypothetical protein [Prescottella agglutinans]
MRIVKYAIIGIVVLGVFRGCVNWADSEGVDSSNVIRLFETAVNTIADLTYRWIPVVINTVSGGGSTASTPAPPTPAT